ncbi:MAG TPA: hypothetical protein VJX10_18910 [Pseudonocardiaceae bacterium]|nr:hypothetical protein [Pseudonocardiaceae bacterium]
MTWIFRRQRDLAELERDLAADPVLRTLTDLFPRPPEPGADRTPATDTRAARLVSRLLNPTWYAVGLVVALIGLGCCLVAAPTHQPALAVAGVVLAACAVPFLAMSRRDLRAREPERAGRR